MADRINELKARAEAGTMTDQERDEFVGMITEAIGSLPKPQGPDASFHHFLVTFAKAAYADDPEIFQGEQAPHLVLADLFKEAYESDRQLEDCCEGAWNEAFPEPDADAEHPAGY